MGDTNRKYITLPVELNYGDIERVHNTNDWDGEDYSHVKERYAENLGKVEKFATQVIEWKPIEEWHEDIGSSFWAVFPVCEPYYAGSPLDDDWPDYHTHFIPMSVFNHLIDDRGNLIQSPQTNSKEGI